MEVKQGLGSPIEIPKWTLIEVIMSNLTSPFQTSQDYWITGWKMEDVTKLSARNLPSRSLGRKAPDQKSLIQIPGCKIEDVTNSWPEIFSPDPCNILDCSVRWHLQSSTQGSGLQSWVPSLTAAQTWKSQVWQVCLCASICLWRSIKGGSHGGVLYIIYIQISCQFVSFVCAGFLQGGCKWQHVCWVLGNVVRSRCQLYQCWEWVNLNHLEISHTLLWPRPPLVLQRTAVGFTSMWAWTAVTQQLLGGTTGMQKPTLLILG